MLTRKTAEKMGRELAAGSRRREKLARVVLTLVKKAGLGQAARAAAPGLGAAFKKLLPYLGNAALGVGGTMLGQKLQSQPGEGGGDWLSKLTGSQKRRPLYNEYQKKMYARQGFNPQELLAQRSAMGDYYGGMDELMNKEKYMRGRQRGAWGF